jgi:AraC family transcriptional regulator
LPGSAGPAPLFDWIPSGSDRASPVPLYEQTLTSGPAWPGSLLREITAAPQERGEGQLSWHAVTVNVGEAVDVEHAVSDQPPTLHRIETGGACVLPAGTTFSSRWREPYRMVWVAISPDLLARAGRDETGGPRELMHERPAADGMLAPLVLALRDEVRAGRAAEPHARQLLSMLISQLVHKHTRSGGPRRPLVGGLSANTARKVTDYIERHLDGQLRLRELASFAGLSVFHFLRCFKRCTGLPPHAYVRERRIERAKQLLARDQVAIAEVAFRCGFSDQSSFARTFHRIVGVTPREFRRAKA